VKLGTSPTGKAFLCCQLACLRGKLLPFPKGFQGLLNYLVVIRTEQVWVSDIFYVRLLAGWAYLSLITDLYSLNIMGSCLHPDLSVRGTLTALH
jgi:transposase InsO family protein